MSFTPQVLNAIEGYVDYSARVAPAFGQVPKHEVDAGMLNTPLGTLQSAESADMLGECLSRDIQDRSAVLRHPTHAKHGNFYLLPSAIQRKQWGPDFVKQAMPQTDMLAHITNADHRVRAAALPNSEQLAVHVGRMDADPEHPIASSHPRVAYSDRGRVKHDDAPLVNSAKPKFDWLLILGVAAVAAGAFFYFRYEKARPTTGAQATIASRTSSPPQNGVKPVAGYHLA